MHNKTTIMVDEEMWKKFRIRALKEGKTASQLIGELISKYLKGENEI
jgi:predicted CopG family antitoxin